MKTGVLAIGWLAKIGAFLVEPQGGKAMSVELDEFVAWASFQACMIRASIQQASIVLQGEYAGDFICCHVIWLNVCQPDVD